jgi:hypothetical protein
MQRHRLSWLMSARKLKRMHEHPGAVVCTCGAMWRVVPMELDGESILISPNVPPVLVHTMKNVGRESGGIGRSAPVPDGSVVVRAGDAAANPHVHLHSIECFREDGHCPDAVVGRRHA